MSVAPKKTTNFSSDQEVRWCPGCGDFAILAQMKKILPLLNIEPENIVFISGIGCSSRFPYYLETYGMHGIHGRAPAIATGLKRVRPDLQVWVVTGDGDGLSIGASQLIHAMRRNVDIKILLFNNRIYGLTKGQFSPTSPPGLITSSTPKGTAHQPLYPLALALASNATFVARSIDTNAKHLSNILKRAAEHRGTAFVEVYQNCHIYNDGAFDFAKNADIRDEHTVELIDGKPLIFGKEKNKAIQLNGTSLEIVPLNEKTKRDNLLIHNEECSSPAVAHLLADMQYPNMPEVIGVLRAINAPTHNDRMPDERLPADTRVQKLKQFFNAGETWEIS